MVESAEITRWISRDTRMFPAIFGAFIFLLFLLFIDKLPEKVQEYTVPSIACYAIGACLIGYVQTMLGIRAEGRIGKFEFWVIVSVHCLWFIALIWYQCFRAVL